MIAVLAPAMALLATAPSPAVRLGAIGRQAMPAQGCAAFLWRAGEGGEAQLVAMATADPATLRLSIDGATPTDLPRVAQRGEGSFGFAANAEYRTAGVTATLAMSAVARSDLRDGAAVPQATLRLMRDGGDEWVVPLSGLVGCRRVP